MMGRRPVRTRSDDPERGAVVSLLQRHVDDVPGDGPFAATRKPDLGGDAGQHPVDPRRRGGEGFHLCGLFADPQRADEGRGGYEPGGGETPLQGEEEPGPRLVADRRRLRGSDEVRHDRHRVFGLGPRSQTERPRADPGGLQFGDDQGGFGVAVHHQHGEPLQRHGLVPAEVGKVGADGDENDVDTVVRHDLAETVEARAVVENTHHRRPRSSPGTRPAGSFTAGRPGRPSRRRPRTGRRRG